MKNNYVVKIPSKINLLPESKESSNYAQKIKETITNSARDLQNVQENMINIQSQNGFKKFWSKGKNIDSIAENIETSVLVQQKMLDLIVLLMGASGKMKKHYDNIISSIDELVEMNNDNAVVVKYLIQLKEMVDDVKDRDYKIDEIASYTNELNDSLIALNEMVFDVQDNLNDDIEKCDNEIKLSNENINKLSSDIYKIIEHLQQKNNNIIKDIRILKESDEELKREVKDVNIITEKRKNELLEIRNSDMSNISNDMNKLKNNYNECKSSVHEEIIELRKNIISDVNNKYSDIEKNISQCNKQYAEYKVQQESITKELSAKNRILEKKFRILIGICGLNGLIAIIAIIFNFIKM